LLWEGLDSTYVFSLDKMRLYSSGRSIGHVYWAEGGDHFVQLDNTDENGTIAHIYHLFPTRSVGVRNLMCDYSYCKVLAITSDLRMYLYDGSFRSSSGSAGTIIVTDLNSDEPSSEFLRMVFPGHALVAETDSLPAEHLLAWLTYRTEGMSVPILGRLLPSFKLPQRTISTIWISKLDGTDLREVGRLSSDGNVVGNVRQIRLVPGAARLSFVHENTLYTVPLK